MTGENAGLYRLGVITWLMVFLIAHSTHSAPVYDEDTTQVAEYEGAAPGCYYNFQYYEEGDRIMTNEPCLNCTCHNRMLMCYLRVCPQFTKAIGQNCQVEKRPDQCCPVITCPEVPVHLLTSTTSAPSSSSDSTEVGFHDNYGCSIDNKFYADGAQLPTDPNNPCELCYCIRNRTTCTMQQCTLKIARCSPVFHPGICCPVKYDCDYDEEPTTTPGTTPGLIMTTTMAPGIESPKCTYQGKLFNDGDLLYSTEPCHHCYCFHGDIACAIQECGKPMETHGKNCTAVTPPEGECCPTTYKCEDESGSIEGEEQQKVTHDENEIVATQAPLPTEKVDEEKQTHESIFPGADNAIPEAHQVQKEGTLDTTSTEPTTQAAVNESQPQESTTTSETNEVAVKDTTPTQVPDDNAVPQEPIEAVTHADETTQYIEELRPTESAVSTETVEHEKLTTIIEDMEATKSPGEAKPEGETPAAVTEMQNEPSEKPSTSLPARSEDQMPIEAQTIQPGEMSTHLPRSENESTETPSVTEPVTSDASETPEEEEKPTTTISESNEIPEGSEAPTSEITAKPEDTMTITSAIGGTGEIKPEEAPTEPSISETPKISEESKPVTELPKTELPEGSEEKTTAQPETTPDIANRITEHEPTSVTGEEVKPNEVTTITPASEHTNTKHEEPATESIEPEMNEVPTQGPPGIVVPTRGPVTKAEDNESVPEVQVTESYAESPNSSEMQTPENLMTDKPEIPVEVSSETAVTGGENITEKPQIPQEEPAVSVTETPTSTPEEQTSGEHIQQTHPTSEATQGTEVVSVDEEQSTLSIQPEEAPATPSTGITEIDMPTKGIQVSGEQSSEEATSSEAPTSEEKQPDSAESSSEEEVEEPSSPFTPPELPSSTESSSKTENDIKPEGQVTVAPEEKETIAPTEHEIVTEKVPMETATEAKPTDENPVEESKTEKSTEVPTLEEKPTDAPPTEEKAPETPVESKPAEKIPISEGPTEQSPVEQPEEKSTVKPEEEHAIEDQQTEERPIEKPIVEQPVEEQTTEGETIEEQATEKFVEEQTTEKSVGEQATEKSVEEQATEKSVEEQATEQSVEEQPAEGEPSEKPMEMLPAGGHEAEGQSTEDSTNVQSTSLKPTKEQPVELEPTDVQSTVGTPPEEPPTEGEPAEKSTEQPSAELEPTEKQPMEVEPIEVKLTTVPSTETQVTEKSTEEPAEAQPAEENPSETQPIEEGTTEELAEKSTDMPPTEEKPSEQPIDLQPEEGKPTEKEPVESQTEHEATESIEETQTTEANPPEIERQTDLPHEEQVTVGVKVETSTSSLNEPLPTVIHAETEQTEGTKIAEELTEPSVTSVPQELSTTVIGLHPTSEEGEKASTEIPVVTEDVTEKEASEQPSIEVKPEMKPEESVKPSEESIPVSDHIEPSIVEQPSTGIDTSEEGEKPQTEQPSSSEEIKPTEVPIAEDKLTEQAPSIPTEVPIAEDKLTEQAPSIPTEVPIAEDKLTEPAPSIPTESPKVEPEQESQTMSSVEMELQTTEAMTEPAVTEKVSVPKETENEGEVQQTPTPSIISTETSETAETEGELTVRPTSTDSAAPEEKPNDESESHPTEMSTPEQKPTEAVMAEVTLPESNELPGQTHPEIKPEQLSTEKAVEATSPSNEQEISMKPVISEEDHPTVTTDGSITDVASTEKIPETEVAHTSVPEQQPNEEPVRTTETSSGIPTTVRSDLPVPHAEQRPVETTDDHTVVSIPAQEQTSQMPTESVTVPAVSAETEQVTQEHETQTFQSESQSEPADVSDELPVSNEQPHGPSETSSSTEPAVATEETTADVEQLTERPEAAQEGEPTEEVLSSAVTSASTSIIEKETAATTSADNETPIEGEQIITDSPASEPSESITKLPVGEENPEVTSPEFIPSTEQRPEMPTESSNQTVESTEQSIEVKLSTTGRPEEPSMTTSEESKPPGIPGEGNCLINGESFTNNSEIPPANPCQISCHCVSSIVQCELVQCPPPPSHLSNCMPIHISSDACCPMYSCDASPTATLESDNQMAGHPEPEGQGQGQETESPMISETPVEESKAPEEPTKQPEEHTAPVITEESTSVAPAETPISSKPDASVTVEQPSNITPKVTSETSEPTETPAVVTKELTTESDIASTSPSVDIIGTTKASEPAGEETTPSIDNRGGETESATSVPEKEIPTEAEPTNIPQVAETEGDVTTTMTPEKQSIAPEATQTESGMVSTEGIKEPTTSIDVHEIMSNATSGPSEIEPSVISTSAEEEPIGEEATTIVAEGPIPEKEPVEESSVQPQEQTPTSEHSNEVTPASPTQELPTEPAIVKPTGAPQPEADTTKPESGASSTVVVEQTTAPIISGVETTAPTHEESGTKPTEGTPTVSDTEIPAIDEEHKQVSEGPSEIPQTEVAPQKTDITPENESATATISEEHPIAEEESTTASSSEGTSQPSITSEEPAKMTEAPESSEVPTMPAIAVETLTPVEPTLSTVSSTELSSSSIAPEILEHPVTTVTEGNETEAANPVTTDSTNITSSESEAPTSAPSTEAKPDIGVTEMPAKETSKPEEEHETATAILETTQAEQVSGEPVQTTSSAAVATEAETTESQFVENETQKPLEITSVASVETDVPIKISPTQGPEEGTEGIKSVTKPSELETSVTEIIATQKASEAPPPTEESAGSEPSPTTETSSQDVNIPVITENPEEENRSPVEEALPSSTGSDSMPTPETPSGEQPSSSGIPPKVSTELPDVEKSTEVAGGITGTPAIPTTPTEIPVIVPEDEMKPTEIPVEEEKEVETGIKTVETPKPMIEEATTQIPQEGEPVGTSSPPEHTPPTTSPVISESSSQSEEVSPTTIAAADEKSTENTEQPPMKPEETSVTQSQASESTTLPTLDENSSQTPIESSIESTQTSIMPVGSEETPINGTKLTEEPDQTIPEVDPVEPVDKTTSTSPPSEPIGDIQGNEVPELPMTPEQHPDTEGQQTISPIEPEVVQEHVTESDQNMTSPHHTYIPPSSTESPTGGEYPDQSVSAEDNPHFPVHGGTQLNTDEDYEEDDQAVYGPGTCRYGGKVYVSAQQIPRDDPCDFCFCFRSDIICLQQSCPPPIPGCHEEPIGGFCCPRYECPVSMATSLNITTTTTTTTTTLPPHFLSHAYKGATRRSGCQIRGQAYRVGEVIKSASGPCMHCICGGDGNMKCEPRVCSPEPMIRQMIAAATAKRRR